MSPERTAEPSMAGTEEKTRAFTGGLALVKDALGSLDAQLARLVDRVREEAPAAEAPNLRGLVITDDEVSRLLAGSSSSPRLSGDSGISETLAGLLDEHRAAARERGVAQPLDVVRERFGLSDFEILCLLVCLAPETDVKYEKLFGYLNDDVTRKYPTVQLLLRLLAPAEEPAFMFRRALLPEAPLLRHHLLTWADDPRLAASVSHLGRCLRVDPGVARFLLEEPGADFETGDCGHRLAFPGEAEQLWQELPAASALTKRLGGWLSGGARGPLVCLVVGPPGSGRRYVIERACANHGMRVIALDSRRVLRLAEPQEFLTRAFRDSILQMAPLFLADADALGDDAERGPDLRNILERLVDELGWIVFLGTEKEARLGRWFSRHRRLELVVDEPSRGLRMGQWNQLLEPGFVGDSREREKLAEALGVKFRLTPGQIAEAYQRALDVIDEPSSPREWWSALHGAASRISSPRLGQLAQRLTPIYDWSDLVLPDRQMELLHDVVRQVKYRRTVMEEWGFERTLSRGRGLNVLFAGPPGTGKTMSAEVIANELGMDLYRIDLASVVSKYIGETEKNLARIFAEAEHSDAILFFDEADALFGKRSEVHDAHDRYANIEINYLMQQMESYEGIAILATNLRQNMDEAFLRRIQIAVDFPFPAVDERLGIWRRVLPQEAPQSPDIDFEFLARTFEISGGNIRNIGLTAAFLSAEERGPITMRNLVRATQRELQKIGKRTIKEEFGRYFDLLKASEQPVLSH